MGDVYRARDTRLDRIVALKVLRDEGSARPDWRERFEREARTIASLNHPHICTLYDIGRENGVDHLVMEYLEGETLASRLAKGPLSIDQVLRYGMSLSDALDKAHRKGITHRDLKPGNIIITKAGPKLLDFGLAKQRGAPHADALSELPTAQGPITAEGTLLGTLPYMAPEQLEGKECDPRTDLFALGAVLYEMATGKRAFDASTQASLIAKILGSEPPSLSELEPLTPKALERVVKRCLAKDPEERWQSAGDLAAELKWIRDEPAADITRPSRSQLGAASTVLAAVLAASVGAVVAWHWKPAPALPLTRTVISLPPGERLAGLELPALALSPDGRELAYVAIRDGVQQIQLRSMDSFETRSVAGTGRAESPFFSPDGQWLGFVADGKLKKISVNGGTPLTLASAASPRGASWGRQGSILFTPIANGVVRRVSEAGGEPEAMTRLETNDAGNLWPELLPDGNAVVFSGGSPSNRQLTVQALGATERRNLSQRGASPRYMSPGYLVFADGATLMVMPFNLERLEATGPAVPVVYDVLETAGGAAQFSTAANGTLVYVSGSSSRHRLVWVDRTGEEVNVGAAERTYWPPQPRLSPDGGRIAVPSKGQIWLYDSTRETLGRFSLEGASSSAAWTPDGERIAYALTREGAQNLFWQKADGSGGVERLTRSEHPQTPGAFSRDGRLLTFVEVDPETGYDVWVLRVADQKVEPLLRTKSQEAAARFSPDGRWLSYVSDESGAREVYVRAYPGMGEKWQISSNGGTEPVWNPDGRELFYREADKMMVVDVVTDPAFSVGKPKLLFDAHTVMGSFSNPSYDISPDGERFLMLKESEETEAITQINVILNWPEELKRIVPTKR